ncbi:MAG: hypothetical protein JWM27_1436, partial [Gemmatimonadetes bacterium]|nr:hypothetical protein [Gemmatimonadota bacterium]
VTGAEVAAALAGLPAWIRPVAVELRADAERLSRDRLGRQAVRFGRGEVAEVRITQRPAAPVEAA